MNTSKFHFELKNRTDEADRIVRKFLPQIEDYVGSLNEALCYSVQAGGKRLRPVMLCDACICFGGSKADAEPFMAAIEYIHTASLIHDDLPAIDNDELRRGKPTVHKAFGEAVGILSGDALLNYAYEVLIKGILSCSNKDFAIKAADIIASKSGLNGMLGGQGLDVECEKGRIRSNDLGFLYQVYKMKTSALIEASLMAGAALGGAKEEDLQLCEQIGRDLGLAFQIQDDLLDINGSERKLGKLIHSDEKNNKETVLSILGDKRAIKIVEELSNNAINNAKRLCCNSNFLQELILYLMKREY